MWAHYYLPSATMLLALTDSVTFSSWDGDRAKRSRLGGKEPVQMKRWRRPLGVSEHQQWYNRWRLQSLTCRAQEHWRWIKKKTQHAIRIKCKCNSDLCVSPPGFENKSTNTHTQKVTPYVTAVFIQYFYCAEWRAICNPHRDPWKLNGSCKKWKRNEF